MIPKLVRLVVADDHPVVIDGLRHTLAQSPAVEIVGSAHSEAALLDELQRCLPQVLLLDLNFRGENALEYLPRIRGLLPGLKVIIFSSYALPSLVKAALAAGVDGYVLKDAPRRELLLALEAVGREETYVCEALRITDRLVDEPNDLTDAFLRKHHLSRRELDVIRLLVAGMNNEAAGAELYISPHTVRTHRKNIMRKLGLRDKAAIVKFALENKLA